MVSESEPGTGRASRREQVRSLLERHRLDAIVLRRFANFAWHTDGADSRVDDSSPFGVAAMVITRDAEFVLADNIEAGRMRAEVFADIQRFYAEEGFPDQWQFHHRGGMTGYATREVVATPSSRDVIDGGQAFAWNPSITGAKAEETFVPTESGPAVVAAYTLQDHDQHTQPEGE